MFYKIAVSQFIHTLVQLDSFLDRGEEFARKKKAEPEILLNSRLALDQFPLSRQIQIACDTAKLGAQRLTGREAPKHPDDEKTILDFKKRIASTIGYLQSLSEKDFAESASRKVTSPYWEGKHLMGDEAFVMHVIPNFYFHVTTAYAILRHNGVEIGKHDFLGKLPFKS